MERIKKRKRKRGCLQGREIDKLTKKMVRIDLGILQKEI